MARRTKLWQNSSIADIARSVASQLNLTPVITGLTDSLPVLVQFNESDLAFLRRLLARYDADMQVVGAEMHVSARKDVARGSIDLELHSQLRRVREKPRPSTVPPLVNDPCQLHARPRARVRRQSSNLRRRTRRNQ